MRILLAALLMFAAATAHAQFNGCAPGFCSTGTASAPATFNRITNVPDTRVTDTGDTRVVAP
jgi:hypothetical protein